MKILNDLNAISGVRVLCIIPPYVPSYFNAGHHLPVFQVTAWLRRFPQTEVHVRDFGVMNATWVSVCRLLASNEYHVIAMMNDFDAIDGFERFIEYAQEIAPQAKLVTFGRASRHIPSFFFRFNFDAIGSSGDYELSMSSYLAFLAGTGNPEGLYIRKTDGRYHHYPATRFLPADQWVFPDINDIPYEAYDRLYIDDLNKFCGLPSRRELVVPVARGCPVGCKFCDVPTQQGLVERRVSVDDVIEYIENAFATHPFEYVSFYAPTFTLKESWVRRFCAKVIERRLNIKWKCVTTIAHLNRKLIDEMAQIGCVRISVGVETTDIHAITELPALKRVGISQFETIAQACTDAGVELNCFLMVGMPNEQLTHTRETVRNLISEGHRVRLTVYTCYDAMDANMTLSDFARFNRQLFPHEGLSATERKMGYSLLYANGEDRPTHVSTNIPTRRFQL